eukprot:XP_011676146.1 PREDICTED: uncharacterized protein LOC105444064 [Strongylocentrotus purpuratus]
MNNKLKPIVVAMIGQRLNSFLSATSERVTLKRLTTYDGFLNRPHDVILHDGKYVITDTYNGSIVARSDSDADECSVLYKAKGPSLPFRPLGIVALSDKENIFLITEVHHEKRGNVFKLNNKKLTNFSSTYTDFRTPRGITLNRKRDRVYIVDSFYNCILEFDMNGTYIDKRGQGNLIRPYFIACNSKDKIYVTDEEGIKVFDPNWKYLTTVKINTFGKLWYYRGIAISKCDDIFITARSRDSFLWFRIETVAAINADHKVVTEYYGGIKYHNCLRGVCIDYEKNRVVVVNGEKNTLSTYTLY